MLDQCAPDCDRNQNTKLDKGNYKMNLHNMTHKLYQIYIKTRDEDVYALWQEARNNEHLVARAMIERDDRKTDLMFSELFGCHLPKDFVDTERVAPKRKTHVEKLKKETLDILSEYGAATNREMLKDIEELFDSTIVIEDK